MFVSRLTQSGASLRAVGSAAIGTAVIAAGLFTTATQHRLRMVLPL